MKRLLFSLSLILASTALADDQAPLPPNPFSNLPTNSDSGFNLFSDDDNAGNAKSPGRPTNAAPRFTSAPRPMGGAPSSSIIAPTNAKKKTDPAASKEVIENFDYPDAEIIDVAKAISKLTGKNFIYNAQDTKGKISIVSETQITVADAWNAFLTALNMKGFALIPSGKYLRIERVASAKEKQTPIYSAKSAPNNDEFITRVIPLRYIDASEFEQTFRLWMPREARMQAYGQTNTLIITDTATHINRMMELISLLDVAGYQESLVVMPIKNAAAKDIAKLIEQIINDSKGGSSGGSSGTYYNPSRPVGSYTPYGAAGGGSGKGQGRGGSTISKIIADDRTNSLIVKANAAGMLEVRALVRRLDSKITASEGSGRIHVIRLQFADAEELSKTLSSITGNGSASSSSSAAGNNNNRFPTYFGAQAQTATVFQGEIKVSADKVTQSLVVTASPQDFSTLKKVVESLDVPQDQVFVQAIIMEIALNRINDFGTSFISAKNGVGLPSASNALTNILSGNPIPAGFVLGFKKGTSVGGFGQSSTSTTTTGATQNSTTPFGVHTLDGLIEMVQSNTDSNVIATPQIVALDNKEASIEISQQIMVSSTTTAASGAQTQSFTPDTASLLLKVTPRINKASNFVKLDIEQKLENFDSSNVPQGLQSTTQGKNTRATKTSAIVENEDTVVLSGLIREDEQRSVQKIPILGDIPILGWLFKNSATKKVKTNLLIFITPSIVKQYSTMRKILNSRIDLHNEFVSDELGMPDKDDPAERALAKIQKGLPKLDAIEPLPTAQPMESTSIAAPQSPDRDEDSYPNGFQGPTPIPLDQINVPQPELGVPQQPNDNAAPPPVIPEQSNFIEGGG